MQDSVSEPRTCRRAGRHAADARLLPGHGVAADCAAVAAAEAHLIPGRSACGRAVSGKARLLPGRGAAGSWSAGSTQARRQQLIAVYVGDLLRGFPALCFQLRRQAAWLLWAGPILRRERRLLLGRCALLQLRGSTESARG